MLCPGRHGASRRSFGGGICRDALLVRRQHPPCGRGKKTEGGPGLPCRGKSSGFRGGYVHPAVDGGGLAPGGGARRRQAVRPLLQAPARGGSPGGCPGGDSSALHHPDHQSPQGRVSYQRHRGGNGPGLWPPVAVKDFPEAKRFCPLRRHVEGARSLQAVILRLHFQPAKR